MLKVRIIPILTFNGFALVKTKQFANPRMVGNPVQAARVYNSRGVDELVFLDIFASNQGRKINLKIVNEVLKECFMPVSIGGGIETLDDINNLLQIGADKIVLNRKSIIDNNFIKEASDYFGSQCITVSIDALKLSNNNYVVKNDFGLNLPLIDYISEVQDKGAGEIILNSVLHDGMMSGFDIELYKLVSKISKIPIVMVGGGGKLEHFNELFLSSTCNSVGSSSIFHFTQFTPLDIKLSLNKFNIPTRI